MEATWSVDNLIGFLGSWSAVRKLIQAQGEVAFEGRLKELKRIWGKETKERAIRWPLYFRIGKIS